MEPDTSNPSAPDKLPDVIRRQKRLGPLDCSLCTDEDRDDSYEADQDDFKAESKVRLVKSDEILFDKMLARNSLNLSNQKHVLEMPDHLQCSIGLSSGELISVCMLRYAGSFCLQVIQITWYIRCLESETGPTLLVCRKRSCIVGDSCPATQDENEKVV